MFCLLTEEAMDRFGVLASSAGTVFRQGREAGAELLGTLGAHVEVLGRPAQRLRSGRAGEGAGGGGGGRGGSGRAGAGAPASRRSVSRPPGPAPRPGPAREAPRATG